MNSYERTPGESKDIIRMASFIMGVRAGLYQQNPYLGIDWARAAWRRQVWSVKVD